MIDPRVGKDVVANRDIDHIWDDYDVDEGYVKKGDVGVIVDIDENDVDVQFGQYTYYHLILGADVSPLYPDE